MRFRQDYVNFRQDFRFYSVREYGVMALCALGAGLVIALLLTAVSGGSAADGPSLKRTSVQEALPATNFAVVQHERDVRVAAQERRARIMAARHVRAVRIRARDRARAARRAPGAGSAAAADSDSRGRRPPAGARAGLQSSAAGGAAEPAAAA